MYKLTNAITPDLLWNTIHMDWQCMHLDMNDQQVTLPPTVTIPLKDKIRAHHMLEKKILISNL